MNSNFDLYEHINNLKKNVDEEDLGRLFVLKMGELSAGNLYQKKLRSKQNRNKISAKKGIIQSLTTYFSHLNYNEVEDEIKLLENLKFQFPFKRVVTEADNQDLFDKVNTTLEQHVNYIEKQEAPRRFTEKLYNSLITNLEKTIYE